MLLLLVEIALTVRAWRKGWKARALLPIGIGMGVAFLLGLAFGSTGAEPGVALVAGIVVDLAIIAALGTMAVRSPAARTAGHALDAPEAAQLRPSGSTAL
jgi:hypothetical protein